MAHRVELVTQMHLVGRDDHPAGGDFVANLLGGEMRLALGDAVHLRRDDAQPGVFELRDRLEVRRESDAADGAVGLKEFDCAWSGEG